MQVERKGRSCLYRFLTGGVSGLVRTGDDICDRFPAIGPLDKGSESDDVDVDGE